MKYSVLYLVYGLFNTTNLILTVLSVGIGIVFVITAFRVVVHYTEYMERQDYSSLEEGDPTPTAKAYLLLQKQIKKHTIIFSVTILIATGFPSGTGVVTYIALRGVDQYAAEHPGSVASPETLLRAADNVGTLVAQVSDVASQFLGTAGRSLKVADTALERANKAIGTDAAKQTAKQEAGAGRQ